MNIKKIVAFTLAEVLLALAIVGTIATMTIPTLNYNKTKKERSVRLKRFYSKMTNAVEMMNLNTPIRSMGNPSGKTFEWYMQYLDPYMGHKAVDKDNLTVYYADGSSLYLIEMGGSCLPVRYDVNGDKAPNMEKKDRFRFVFCFSGANTDLNNFFHAPRFGSTRAKVLQKCKTYTQDSSYCTQLLEMDNWEFKSDYPFKI